VRESIEKMKKPLPLLILTLFLASGSGGAVALVIFPTLVFAQTDYVDQNGKLRIALNKQPFVPRGTSQGPHTMANGGIQDILKGMGAIIRITESRLTEEENKEYGNWKRLGYALGHLGETVEKNEKEGYFNIGFLGTCPSLPGMLAGLQHSGSTPDEIKIGLLWLDAHGDFNTPETTRSGSLGGMPVAVATGRCLHRMRLDAGLDPPISERHVVMGAVRLNDPLEQHMLDQSYIQQLSVDDIRNITPAVHEQLDRLSQLCDKIYVHVDMDVLDPAEVPHHGNAVPDGPSSRELATLFKMIFSKYPKASALGFATIPSNDPNQVGLKAIHNMVVGAVEGLQMREGK